MIYVEIFGHLLVIAAAVVFVVRGIRKIRRINKFIKKQNEWND